MSQWFIIAMVLVCTNVATLVLLVIHMIKFQRLNENFNHVVSNIQTYLNYILNDQEEEKEQSRQKEMREKEEILGQVLGELFTS